MSKYGHSGFSGLLKAHALSKHFLSPIIGFALFLRSRQTISRYPFFTAISSSVFLFFFVLTSAPLSSRADTIFTRLCSTALSRASLMYFGSINISSNLRLSIEFPFLIKMFDSLEITGCDMSVGIFSPKHSL